MALSSKQLAPDDLRPLFLVAAALKSLCRPAAGNPSIMIELSFLAAPSSAAHVRLAAPYVRIAQQTAGRYRFYPPPPFPRLSFCKSPTRRLLHQLCSVCINVVSAEGSDILAESCTLQQANLVAAWMIRSSLVQSGGVVARVF